MPTTISNLTEALKNRIVDELAVNIYHELLMTGNCTTLSLMSDEYHEFQQYALISRDFTKRVQKHLFKVITIRDEDSLKRMFEIFSLPKRGSPLDEQESSLAKGHSLLSSLKKITVDEGILFHPAFMHLIGLRKACNTGKTLVFNITGGMISLRHTYRSFSPEELEAMHECVKELQISRAEVLPWIIAPFFTINTLCIENTKFVGAPICIFKDTTYFQFPHLTKLVLVNIKGFRVQVPAELIACCMNVETLILDNVDVDTRGFRPAVRLPRIKNLGLGFTDAPISNLVDLSQLRIYEDRNWYLLDAASEAYFEEAKRVLEASSETLESFYICRVFTSYMGEDTEAFNLANMNRLSCLTMDIEVTEERDTVEYILNTLRTLRPRSVTGGKVFVYINLFGDDQGLVGVLWHADLMQVAFEMRRLSEFGSAELTIQVDDIPPESVELRAAFDTCYLRYIDQFPNMERVTVKMGCDLLGQFSGVPMLVPG